MKLNKFLKNQAPAGPSPPVAAANNLKPSPDEVAKRAYLIYVNQGSLPGHDQQHWLEAEAQLVAERKPVVVQLFRNWGLE